MSLYVYCLMENSELSTPCVPGIQDRIPHFIKVEEFLVLACDFSGSDLQPTKEMVLAHERVVESFLDTSTLLPFRFGSVVSEAGLREFIQANAATLGADLDKVRGCVEMGLKVMSPAGSTSISDVEAAERPGTTFLKAKLGLLQVQKEVAGWVGAAVAGIVRQSDVSMISGAGQPIVRIAHLVLRYHLDEYKSHIDTLVQQRTDCGFLRSGPWPPYSFISTPRVG